MSARFSPLDMIKQQQEENKYRTQVLDLREVQEHPKNDFPITQSDINNLADSILKSGGVLQFPLVRLLKDGTYQMLAGHRRRRASLFLGETEDEKYYRCMCYVLEDISDERAELYLIDTNIQARDLTPKLRARKVADARHLIETLRDRGELEIRSVKRAVAEHTGISESSVILQTRIAEKLDPSLMELYDQGAFTMREAYDYSGLSENSQVKILEAYLDFQVDLNKEKLEARVASIMQEDLIGSGKPHPREKEANKKIKQVHKRLADLSELKQEGIQLNTDALKELESLIIRLLADK